VPQHVVQLDKPLEDVGSDQKQVGRERIALAQPTKAAKPFPRNAVEHDGRTRGGEDGVHPVAPKHGKSSRQHNSAEAGPADGVESLGEVKLEDDAGGTATEACLNQLRGVDKILGDASTGQEAGLVDVNDLVDLPLEAENEGFAQGLHGAVLEGHGAERAGLGNTGAFGEEGDVGTDAW
jgi:hypothetical protein